MLVLTDDGHSLVVGGFTVVHCAKIMGLLFLDCVCNG